jgi:hypothetical protein
VGRREVGNVGRWEGGWLTRYKNERDNVLEEVIRLEDKNNFPDKLNLRFG